MPALGRRASARPNSQVAAGLALMPARPGVYLMRDERGRVIYIGRSGNLRARIRSYWGPLGGRRRLVRMRERVVWVEPVILASEHEAAFLERHLLHLRRPVYNRALGGQESWIWLRLATSPAAPGLAVVHEPEVGEGEILFGPYLGGSDARLAAAALLRLYPVAYTMARPDSSAREMGRLRGVGPEDRQALLERIQVVLDREPAAVAAALGGLAVLRDEAALGERYEDAGIRQQQLQAIDWVTQPQGIAAPAGPDLRASAIGREGGATVQVTFEIRSGSFRDRHTAVLDPGVPDPVAAADAHWTMLAQANADLMARLVAAGAVGEGLGRLTGR